jgi:hypothetical protein
LGEKFSHPGLNRHFGDWTGQVQENEKGKRLRVNPECQKVRPDVRSSKGTRKSCVQCRGLTRILQNEHEIIRVKKALTQQSLTQVEYRWQEKKYPS